MTASRAGSTDVFVLRPRGDLRSGWLRKHVRLGIPLVAGYGLLFFYGFFPSLDERGPRTAWTFMTCSLLFLTMAELGRRREVQIRRYARTPPPPRLGTTEAGEPALVIPYDEKLAELSGWATVPLASALAAGSVLVLAPGRVPESLCLAFASWFVWRVGAPFDAAGLAGGVYLSASGIAFRRDGVSWSVPWTDVDLVRVHKHYVRVGATRTRVKVRRTIVSGRFRGRVRSGRTLLIDQRWLGADAASLAWLVGWAVKDHHFRSTLGTAATLALVTGETGEASVRDG